MKMLWLATALTIFSVSIAVAQEAVTISELLDDGYDIVAASSNDDRWQAFVFLQKRSSAYMCFTNIGGSSCFSLNNHSN
jgi:hypothetical protein